MCPSYLSHLSSCLFIYLGHNAYVGFLYLEHTYNNAVVQMFMRLMVGSLIKSGRVTPGGSGKLIQFCIWRVLFLRCCTQLLDLKTLAKIDLKTLQRST